MIAALLHPIRWCRFFFIAYTHPEASLYDMMAEDYNSSHPSHSLGEAEVEADGASELLH